MSNIYPWLQVIILGGTGAYFAYTAASGNITNYIAVKFVWLTWSAAALLLAMAGIKGAALRRGAAHDAHSHHGSGHNHAHHTGGIGAWIGLGIVALPALLGTAVPSAPLDSRALDTPIESDLGGISASPGETIGIAPEDRNVLDWLRAISAEPDLNVFTGQEAALEGFVYRDGRFDEARQFMVARFVISCCVADAQAIGVVVVTPQSAGLAEDTWVRVRGVFEVADFDGARTVILVAYEDGLESIERPAHPYLYP